MNYLEQIKIYGAALPTEKEKQIARAAFNDLTEQGFSYQFIYFSIRHLNNRNIANHKNLLFYKPFQNEVQEIIDSLNVPLWKILNELERLYMYGKKCLSDNGKRLGYLLENSENLSDKETLELYDIYILNLI